MTPTLDTILGSLKVKLLLAGVVKTYYLARIDEEGRVLIPSEANTNEFTALSPSDTETTYCYIRHRDSGEIYMEEVTEGRKLSCTHNRFDVRYDLRMVICGKKLEAYTLEEDVRKVIASCHVPDFDGLKNIRMKPVKSSIDSIAVLKAETPNPKQFDKNLTFIAIDFDLTYEMNYF